MDKVAAIRHSVLVCGHSRRWASRAFDVSRKTVDRYVDGDVEPGKRKAVSKVSPQRDKAIKALDAIISVVQVDKKQRLTAKRAHELIVEGGDVVGVTLVKELMAQRRRAAKEVFVPLEYPPGDLAEVDFFEAEVDVAGERKTVHLFVMRLMSSGRDFCWLYPRQDQVCFLDGHVRAFEFFGGVPARCAYDNLKAAVKKILVGSERQLSPRFLALTVHATFEANFCRPYTGHDKGGVEARGKNIRLQSLVPIPSGATLDDINETMLADVDRRYRAKQASAASWSTELAALNPPPRRRFDARRPMFEVPVSSRSTVTIEGAMYSVPSSWARLRVTTYAGVDEVEARCGEASVVRRRIPKGARDIDYAAHYLDVLCTKPQAVRQVAGSLMAQLGGGFPAVWAKLVEDHGASEAARKMARILRGVVELGRDECERRVSMAMAMGESVSRVLLVPVIDTPSSQVVVPGAFEDVVVELSSVAHFDALLTVGGVH